MSKRAEQGGVSVSVNHGFSAFFKAPFSLEPTLVYFSEKYLQAKTPDAELRFRVHADVKKAANDTFPNVLTRAQVEWLKTAIATEQGILELLNERQNPYVPRLLEVRDNALVLEFITGELGQKYRWRTLSELWDTLEQLVLAVYSIYQDGVVNLDLAGRNIIIDTHRPKHRRVKAIDFGMALQHQADTLCVDRVMFELMSNQLPEVARFLATSETTFTGSGWAYTAFCLGEVIAELSCGYDVTQPTSSASALITATTVFSQSHFHEFFLRRTMGYGSTDNHGGRENIDRHSALLANLIENLLQPDPTQRPDVDSILTLIHEGQAAAAEVPTQTLRKQPNMPTERSRFISAFSDGTTLIAPTLLRLIELELKKR